MRKRVIAVVLTMACVMGVSIVRVRGQDLTTDLALFLRDLRNQTLGTVNTILSLTATRAGIGTTSTDGVLATNTTAATAAVPVQVSPRTRWCGTAWNSVGLASETNCFFAEALPATVAGTTTATWKLGYIAPSGAVTYPHEVNSVGTIISALTSATVPQFAGPQAQGTGMSFSPNANNVINLLIDNTLRWQVNASGHLVGQSTQSLLTGGLITSTGATAGIGYAAGAGGTITQDTNKATPVTLNTVTGEITMNGAALGANTVVSFTLTNSAIAAGDYLSCQHISTGTAGAYNCTALAATGSATINVRNLTAGSLSEAIVLKYLLLKAATS